MFPSQISRVLREGKGEKRGQGLGGMLAQCLPKIDGQFERLSGGGTKVSQRNLNLCGSSRSYSESRRPLYVIKVCSWPGQLLADRARPNQPQVGAFRRVLLTLMLVYLAHRMGSV